MRLHLTLKKKCRVLGNYSGLKSIEQIGNAMMLSRAIAGVARGKVVFCLPGSLNAVKLALELVMPEIGHIIKHVKGQ
jgi:molybdenum cofactor biosynthesis protein B